MLRLQIKSANWSTVTTTDSPTVTTDPALSAAGFPGFPGFHGAVDSRRDRARASSRVGLGKESLSAPGTTFETTIDKDRNRDKDRDRHRHRDIDRDRQASKDIQEQFARTALSCAPLELKNIHKVVSQYVGL